MIKQYNVTYNFHIPCYLYCAIPDLSKSNITAFIKFPVGRKISYIVLNYIFACMIYLKCFKFKNNDGLMTNQNIGNHNFMEYLFFILFGLN